MISQAYIFGALGKAAFKENEKWYVLDNDAPNSVRAWHTFDNNYLALSDPETVSVPEGKNLDDIRQLLALETTKQEALTLALQLMDSSIGEESLKAEIAELLSKYTQNTEIFHFLENRLLTTIVPDSFDPSFASNICHSLRLNEIARVYEMLTAHAGAIQIFYTAWVKAAKNHFPDVETADAAFSLLTSKGIAKAFVQSISHRDKSLWDKAVLDAVLLVQKEGLGSDESLFFTQLKADLTQYFKIKFIEKTIPAHKGTTETNDNVLINIFISHVEADRKEVEKFLQTLKPLHISKPQTRFWHRGLITPGTVVEQRVAEEIGKANFIIVLLSSNYLADPHIITTEFTLIKHRLKEGQVNLIPVISQPSLLDEEIFSSWNENFDSSWSENFEWQFNNQLRTVDDELTRRIREYEYQTF